MTLAYTGLDGGGARPGSTSSRRRAARAPTGASSRSIWRPHDRRTIFLEIRCGAGLRRPRAAPRLLRRLPRRPPGAARRPPRARRRSPPRTRSSTSGAPLGRRPLHAGHRDRARPLSLRRHPLVQHALRPRRADHRAADAVARPRRSPAACCATSPPPGDRGRRRRRRRARQDPARDAPRRDGRAREVPVRPLLRQRRLDAAVRRCWPAPTSTAPATSPRVRELWPAHRGGARLDRRSTATATATASSSTAGRTPTAWSTRAGRTATIRSSTPTATLAQGPIALCEVQAYAYGAWRAARLDRRAG